MLRLLSWSSGLAADKITPQEIDYLAPQRLRSPAVELQKPPVLKRKRVDSSPVGSFKSPLKPGGEETAKVFAPSNNMSLKEALSALPHVTDATPACPVLNRQQLSEEKMEIAQSNQDQPANEGAKPEIEMLRQTLNSQISLEILLKHNELRLIDQEIAKCQIALEQLRRCNEIPYPFVRPSQNVSQGEGPAIRSSRSAVQPESPAPWGVTDGPYTRHYAKWLLPDPLFDGGSLPGKPGPLTPAGKTPAKGRSTRGSFADPSTPAGKSRIQRAGKFQALSHGYPPPKDKAGPMIQKRKSDGLLVKLVCLDCRRDNFSSAQGFINHCRIAHSRNFASHDAAADACGEPVDIDEAGAVVGGEGHLSTFTAGLVHPLIYSAHLLKQESPRKTSDSSSDAFARTPLTASPSDFNGAKDVERTRNSLLTPSRLTPNLSTLMRKQGANLDLGSLVSDMKMSIPAGDSTESESENGEDTIMTGAPHPGRHPHVTGSMQPALSIAAPGEASASRERRKGLKNQRMPHVPDSQPSVPPAPAPAKTITPSRYVAIVQGEGQEASPTNDSNQAPSLVDDDGDDEYEAHSPSYSCSGSVDTENRELDFAVEDGDESEPSTQNRSTEPEYASTPKHHASPASARRTSAFRRSISGREEKHVSFVSLNPARGAEPSKKGSGRKRRRTKGFP